MGQQINPFTILYTCLRHLSLFSRRFSPKLQQFLSNSFLNIQLLVFLVNGVLQIFPFITPEILLSDNECMSYHANQILLHSLCLDLSYLFVVMTSLLNFFDDYDSCTF